VVHKDEDKLYTESQVRAKHPSASFPTPFNPASLGYEVVFPTPIPAVNGLQTVLSDGVERGAKGNLVMKWGVRDMFADYTDDSGVLHTKAEQEEEYLARQRKAIVQREITKVQVRAALVNAGKWDAFKAILAANEEAKEIFELATSLQRDHPLVISLAPLLELDDAALDELFIFGATQ